MYCAIRDSRGFLWIGCTDGLLRFDGYKIREFNATVGDSTQLQNDYINTLFEDSKGNIWILSQEFVSVFDYQSEGFKSFRIPHESFATALSILEDSEGKIWIATTEGYGQVSPTKGWTDYKQTDSIDISDIVSGLSRFYQDQTGAIWLDRNGHDLKLEINPANKKSFSVGDSSQMSCINLLRQSREHASQATKNEIFRDRNGNFWSYGLNYPLVFWDGKPENPPVTISEKTYWKVSEDFEGNIWATSTKTISVWQKEQLPIDSYFIEEERGIYSIAQHSDGSIWAGGPNGVYHYTKNQNGSLHLAQQWNGKKELGQIIESQSVHFLTLDSKNRLWAGTRNGLHYFNPKKQRFQPMNYPIDGNRNLTSDTAFVYCLLEVENEIWMGTKAGIYILDEAKKCFRVKNESILSVYCLAQDENGRVWAGTGNGLFRVDEYSQTHYQADFQKANGLKDNTIMGIRDDRKGNLLLSTLGAGLSKFNKQNETFTEFNKSANIISNNSYGTLITEKGVWLSTIGGVGFLPNNQEQFINITKENGMPLTELNQNAYFQSSDGWLYFGGTGGMFRVHPDSISFDEGMQAPKILNWKINYEAVESKEKIRIFGNEPFCQTQKINLSPTEKALSFEISALNLFVPSQIKYAFRLQGYNEKWIEREADSRQVTYTNLPVGNYMLQVKATNEFGVWSKEIREVEIEVHPSFTQTAGFKVLMVLSIAGLLASLGYVFQRQRYLKEIRRMESQHQVQLERQRISRDLHDNIGSQLTNIATKLEITAYQMSKNQSSEEIQERIEKVGDEARITIGLLRETIWAIQQDSFTLAEFASKLQQHLERNISQPTTYKLDFEQSELAKAQTINANQALNLFRIFQEAIQNITKHAQATEVNVGLDFTQSKLILSIGDNGLGMDLESAKAKINHYGLTNMQARATEIGGEMKIESELGKGTVIQVQVQNSRIVG